MRMGLLHDIQEAIVGDIMPEDKSKVSKEKKHKLEKAAVAKLVALLPADNPLASELPELFAEYEEGETATARFVKDLDKAEMLMQALEYEEKEKVDLSEFYHTTYEKIQHVEVKRLVDDVMQQRAKGKN
jgi:putative hydrolase of HD superfamily